MCCMLVILPEQTAELDCCLLTAGAPFLPRRSKLMMTPHSPGSGASPPMTNVVSELRSHNVTSGCSRVEAPPASVAI